MLVMSSGHTISTEPGSVRVRVMIGGVEIADSDRAVLLHETGLPVRYYLPTADVRMDLLAPTETSTTCPFKGEASYWSASLDGREVPDVAWSYPTPIAERADIAGLVCFYPERVDALVVDPL